MGLDLLRKREAGGEQEGGPVDAVEADDLLADEVEIGRPVFGEAGNVLGGIAAIADGGDVVDQRVEPDVDDVLRIVGDGNAPLEAGARDGEVFEAAAHEAEDLVAAGFGFDRECAGFDEFDQLRLILREAEEIVFFGDPLRLRPVVRAFSVDEILIEVVRFAPFAVVTLVPVLVNVALIERFLDERLDDALMVGVRGADKPVVADVDLTCPGKTGPGSML